VGHVVAPEPTSIVSVVRSYSLRGSVWMHALLIVLTSSLYAGVPIFYDVDRGPRAHLERGCEPTGGANFSTSRSVILSFYSAVDSAPTINVKTLTAGPWEVPKLKVWERPPPT
jgi:hypothetical protein